MIVEQARRIADDVLFPSAAMTDAAALVPKTHLDALADAGLYGMVAPKQFGGEAGDLATACAVTEILAGACLTTTFVWIQHHGAVRAVANSASAELRAEWLRPLCDGRVRAGVALGGIRPEPLLRARAVAGGWVLNGTSPWVTGWGRIDVVHTAARAEDDTIVWALVDAAAGPALTAEPLPLVAVAASGTVVLAFSDLFVPAPRVTGTVRYEDWVTTDAAGLRLNGSLALGIAARCCDLLGPTPFDEQLVACRADLDAAPPATMPVARAEACALATRATAALIVSSGSTSILSTHHPQRLAREAMFLSVFGSRPPIRAALLERLSVRHHRNDGW